MSAERGTVVAVSRSDVYTFTKPNRDEIVLVAGLGVEGDAHAGVNVRHRSRVAADPSQPNLRQVHLIHAELFGEVGGKGYDVPAGGLGENLTTNGIDLLGLPRGTILRFGPRPGATPAPNGATLADRPGLAAADGAALGEAGPVAAVLAAAAAATLDEETARAAAAVAAAVERDAAVAGTAEDLRPAVVVAGLRNPCAQINGFRQGLLKEVLGRDGDGNLVRKAGVMGVVLRGGAVRPGDAVTVELPPGPHGPLERV
ncbi:transcription elongation factor [Actinoplanes sp. NEAU-A12]|uniref:Transcription elongation factor n=1 Tax=Actinoplanes sandaracinus TaxID=3045177 RepID=A0ABT6WEU8_9ACTN|nr:transcription elongation factor [Actinoplanes sandaracinus]MDI6098264.1 transcription elongation factor [Actinoplanes sandaracinus]